MGTTLNRHAYQRLINEDLEWLLKQPRTLERDHIEAIVRISPKREYETSCDLCHEPLAFCRCRTIGRISINRETETEKFERVSESPSPTAATTPPLAALTENACSFCEHPASEHARGQLRRTEPCERPDCCCGNYQNAVKRQNAIDLLREARGNDPLAAPVDEVN